MTIGSYSHNFKVNLTEYKHYNVISFENKTEIDLYNIGEVNKIFKEGNRQGIEDWVIDLTPIQFVDSSGLSGLVKQTVHLNKLGKMLILLNPSRSVMASLKTFGSSKVFSILFDKSEL